LSYKIEENEMGRACSKYGGEERLYRALVGKPEGKRPLDERLGHRWKVTMDIQEVGYGDMDWIELAVDKDRWRALVNAVMNTWVP
jgi:hypothetical protein